MTPPPPTVPLCVDCDGTLIRTDLLHEGLLLLAKQAPLSLLQLPLWLSRGKAYFKHRLAERVRFQWDTLPYSAPVLELMHAAREEQRPVVLATASPKPWADAVAAHLGGFAAVVATEGDRNLGGQAKADRLSALYGRLGFDYIGDSRKDLPVWSAARSATVVSASASLVERVRAVTRVAAVVRPARARVLDYVKMIRAHQWLKNLLIWVPVAAAHRLSSSDGLIQGGLAFASFSLCASSVYVINDLVDLDADRQHVRKRNRPLAAGKIPLPRAMVVAPVLLLLSVALATLLNPGFQIVLAAYFALTVAYSFRLKRQVIVDVILLAALYTMRVIAGAAATSVKPSFWLLAFSMFVFLSLAIVKRYSEMLVVLGESRHSAAGRGYLVTDLPVLLSLGVSAGMAAVLVLALYINDPETRRLYPSTVWLWTVPPLLLYWISRIWMKAHRGQIDDDPVVFAARDWQSLATLAVAGACFVLASLS